MLTLEKLLTSRTGFGLVTATPLQRAICRASDGLPLGDLWEHQEVQTAFGGMRPPEEPPATMCILAAIRCAKSMMAAAKAIQMSQAVDLSVPWISPGDEIRIPIVSLDRDKARAVYSHVLGAIQSKPTLQRLLIGEPTAESIWIRHPSGRPIEITVSVLAKAGGSLVARWLAGVIFDEAPRMSGDSESKKGLEANLVAVQGRILPGCQTWLIGSPWAPLGPVYELVQQHFSQPSTECVVVRGTGPALNPVYWTPERCERLKNSNTAEGKKAYRTDVLGEFTDLEEGIFSSALLEDATRAEPLVIEPVKRQHYAAALDPATRSNSWTLVIGTCTGFGGVSGVEPTYSVVLAQQWIGTKDAPLQPESVLCEIAGLCKRYGIDTAYTDQHQFDALANIADRHGLTLMEEAITAKNRLEMVERVEVIMSQGCLEIPDDKVLRNDLLQARRRLTVNGVTLVLPRGADGRHADYVPAMGLLMMHPPELPDAPERVVDEDFERAKAAVDRGGADYWERVLLRVGS